jgi:hypothetical protein
LELFSLEELSSLLEVSFKLDSSSMLILIFSLEVLDFFSLGIVSFLGALVSFGESSGTSSLGEVVLLSL